MKEIITHRLIKKWTDKTGREVRRPILLEKDSI